MSTTRFALLVIIMICIAFLLVVGGVVYWFVAARGLRARAQPPWIEVWSAGHLLRSTIPRAAAAQKNPIPCTAQNAEIGQQFFIQKCAICHGYEGSRDTEIGQGEYPHPRDLRSPPIQAMTHGTLFYIIRNGVRYTGMPSWQMPDEQIWRLVIFIRTLPKQSSGDRTRKSLDLIGSLAGYSAVSRVP